MWVAFAFAARIFYFSKNTCELDIVLTRTVNILTTNELFKLTTLNNWVLIILDHWAYMDVIENKVSRVLKLCSGKSAASYITAHEQPQFKSNLPCLVYL